MVRNLTWTLEVLFAISSLVAGGMAIFLEKQWFKSIEDSWKTPLYGMIGASYSFITIYAMVEAAEIIKEAFSRLKKDMCLKEAATAYRPLVVTNLQYLLLLVSSLFSGTIFGLMFGLTDVEQFVGQPNN